MMTLPRFELALWTLKLLDMQELVDAGQDDNIIDLEHRRSRKGDAR
jgi:hypothetical protein